eukprot:scaffold1722_cov120-Cylindrotheca_fusiformis.AAC.2
MSEVASIQQGANTLPLTSSVPPETSVSPERTQSNNSGPQGEGESSLVDKQQKTSTQTNESEEAKTPGLYPPKEATSQSNVPDSTAPDSTAPSEVSAPSTPAVSVPSPDRPRKRPAAKSLVRGIPNFWSLRASTRAKEKDADGDVKSGESANTTAKATTKKAPATRKAPTARKAPAKKAKPVGKKATAAKARKNGAAEPIWVGEPTEPLEGGWPEGWTKRVYERQGGATKGQTDRYWYSPKEGYKFRSMVEVRRFFKALEMKDGDEVEAKKIFKSV